jgi:hypothetical protein
MVVAGSVSAQNFSIDWYKISGGGGTSSGGNFSLSGTIGQTDAGSMTGGSYSLDGGFWSIANVVQTPGAPLLTISVSGNNYILSWPAASTGFHVEVNGNLGNSGGWSTVPQSASTNAATISVVVPATAGNSFFRLKYP